jgi:hypothetical protein
LRPAQQLDTPEEQRQPENPQRRRADQQTSGDEPFVGLTLRKLRSFSVIVASQQRCVALVQLWQIHKFFPVIKVGRTLHN